MTTRLATSLGIASAGGSTPRGDGLVVVQEPRSGADRRGKGCLYLVAHASGDPRARAAARSALDGIAADYAHDLTGGVPVALARAVATANRRLFHQRARLGIPEASRIGVVALVVHERDAYTARIGPATAVLVRHGALYELPPPPSGSPTSRRVAVSAGEALEVEPATWEGPLVADDRIGLLSRRLARSVGHDSLTAILSREPRDAAAALANHVATADTDGDDRAVLVAAIHEAPMTESNAALRAVRPASPLAGLEESLPLADALSQAAAQARGVATGVLRGLAAVASRALAVAFALSPRRRVAFPEHIPRTDHLRDGRRRRLGGLGMIATAAIGVAGVTLSGGSGPPPTDAIPRLSIARDALSTVLDALVTVDARISGADLIDRDEDAAVPLLLEADAALDAAERAGIPAADTARLRDRVWRGLDRAYDVSRVAEPTLVADLRSALEDFDPRRMVAASDGSLWVLDGGRLIRVDPATGEPLVVLRAGEAIAASDGRTPAEPWLVATAATDVVVVDRDGSAWRIDLVELVPRPMPLAGIGSISRDARLLTALQHRPPLEIFTLYLVDPRDGGLLRWAPPPVIPVEFPDAPEPYLESAPDLDPRDARDLLVDSSAWLLHASTVTRVDFGTPQDQDAYSLDAPPDAQVRPGTDYRLLEATRAGDREVLYVYDAAHDRIVAFGRADGGFIRQWLATRAPGETGASLGDVRGLSIPPVADGPPVAYLLTEDGVARLVLE